MLALFTSVFWVFDVSFARYVAAVQVFWFAFFGLFFIFDFSRGKPSATDGTSRPLWLAVAFVVFVGAFFYWAPHSIQYDGDAYDHIGYTRSIIREDRIVPNGVLAPSLEYRDPVAGDPRKGVFHPMLGAVSVLSQVEPIDSWRWLPTLLAPLSILAFFAFSTFLLPNLRYVLFAVGLFLMFQGGIGREFLGRVADGQHFPLYFYWVLTAIAVRYGASYKVEYLVAVLLLVAGGTLIYFGVLIHFMLLLLALVIFNRLFFQDLRGVVRLGGLSVVVGLVVFAWKLGNTLGEPNILHMHPQGLLFLSDAGSNRFVSDPIHMIRIGGLLFLVGLCLLPGLLLAKRHRHHARLILALSVPSLFIAINPWLAPFVYGKGSYLLHRFLLNVPVFAATSLAIGGLIHWGRRGGSWKRVVAGVVVFVWAKLFLAGAGAWFGNVKEVRLTGAKPVATGAVIGALDFMREKVPPGSVVLSDPASSYMISALADVRVVSVLNQHGNPNDPAGLKRLQDVQRAMSPLTTQGDAVDVADTYAVNYVLVNGTQPPINDFLAQWNPHAVNVLRMKFGSLFDTFDPVYDKDEVTIYRVMGGSAGHGHETWFPEQPFLEPLQDVVADCMTDSDLPVQLVGAAVQPKEVRPGDTVALHMVYRRHGEPHSMLPLKLFVRINHEDYFEKRSYPGDKYVRRYNQRLKNIFYRLRIDHIPFAGFYPPTQWPIDRDVFDRLEITLPSNLARGRYTIHYKLVEDSQVPNSTLRDLLFDDDSYQGQVCSRLVIE